MFYVIRYEYVGPNWDQDEYVDLKMIEISTVPARTNTSHEICVDGWCGTTNNVAVYAHGEYTTIEDARAAIRDIFGDVRQQTIRDYPFDPDLDTIVEAYKPGRYAPMGRDWTIEWCYETVKVDVTVDTTDDHIEELINEYETEANREGYTLQRRALKRFMLEYQQELREEVEETRDQ